jgi:hypothetical protein
VDDREFFDELFQMWSKTTGAEHRYWMPQDYEDHSGRFRVYAVAEDESRKLVAEGMSDADSDWLTAVHGSLPDMWRRLHSALDEADEADHNRDARECRIAELELELIEMKRIIQGLSTDPPWRKYD